MRRFRLSILLTSHFPKPHLLALSIATGLFLLGSLGCGRADLGRVSGKVTLDGAPLPEAFVEFVPTGGQGSTASGRTDKNGEYELMFSRDVRGASLGPNAVRITTRDVVSDEEGRDVWLPEKVPARYNAESELSVEVQPGRNRFDFDLQSE